MSCALEFCDRYINEAFNHCWFQKYPTKMTIRNRLLPIIGRTIVELKLWSPCVHHIRYENLIICNCTIDITYRNREAIKHVSRRAIVDIQQELETFPEFRRRRTLQEQQLFPSYMNLYLQLH
jgi:hypothetical protein